MAQDTPHHDDLPDARFPVSIKGVLFVEQQVVLLQTERGQWDLPGGLLEPGEDPMDCLVREIAEGLGIDVSVTQILDCWLHDSPGEREVLVVTYGCVYDGGGNIALTPADREAGLFPLDALDGLAMPENYRTSIRRCHLLQRHKS